jgi:hypothetical protein
VTLTFWITTKKLSALKTRHHHHTTAKTPRATQKMGNDQSSEEGDTIIYDTTQSGNTFEEDLKKLQELTEKIKRQLAEDGFTPTPAAERTPSSEPSDAKQTEPQPSPQLPSASSPVSPPNTTDSGKKRRKKKSSSVLLPLGTPSTIRTDYMPMGDEESFDGGPNTYPPTKSLFPSRFS